MRPALFLLGQFVPSLFDGDALGPIRGVFHEAETLRGGRYHFLSKPVFPDHTLYPECWNWFTGIDLSWRSSRIFIAEQIIT